MIESFIIFLAAPVGAAIGLLALAYWCIVVHSFMQP
jgi:hypothetical protein